MGPASLVLYDVSTLYFETDKADGFREPGFAKERRLEPQITIGLLADVGAYHQLWRIEKSFRMSKNDLAARRSTTICANPSTHTSASPSPPWPSATG